MMDLIFISIVTRLPTVRFTGEIMGGETISRTFQMRLMARAAPSASRAQTAVMILMCSGRAMI